MDISVSVVRRYVSHSQHEGDLQGPQPEGPGGGAEEGGGGGEEEEEGGEEEAQEKEQEEEAEKGTYIGRGGRLPADAK